ncbi:MAG: amino acid transporter [Elusimicrobia bacterium RIFCSPLOWO2_12_FULL_59_9]|nr:MAG: amino acid transporter [Elusimicrobia bacterium RIFCSPLOWO2_12_FULL_59_9]
MPTPTGEFKREFKLLDSTMVVIGSMIGSGIFIVSADIARTVGSPGWLLLVWLITGILTVSAALSYGELAGMMPQAGGQYVYLREAYSPLVGFLYGWTLFLVIQTGSIAAVAVAFAKFTAVLIPWFSEEHVLASAGRFKFSAAQLLAVGSIAALTGVNLLGVHQGKIIQNVFTAAKTAALLGLIAIGAWLGRNHAAIAANLSSFWPPAWTHLAENGTVSFLEPLSGLGIAAAVGVAMVGSLFASDGWNNITFIAGEVENPRRSIPLSLALGCGVVTLLYVLANVVYLLALPLAGSPEGLDVMERGVQFAANDRVGTAAASMILGAPAAALMAVLIMISTFGCNNGMILTGARAYYAMAQDGLFFKRAGGLNRNAVPGAALILQGIWACLLCLSGTYGDLLDYVVFAVLVFYGLTVAGIFVLRARRPEAERPYRAFLYPWLPLAYVAAVAAICVDLLIFKPVYTWPGLGIVLSGIPVYFLWKRSERRGGSPANVEGL